MIVNDSQPWVEKYRPITLNGLNHQGEISNIIRGCLESGNLPHILFHGPPGTGKTTMALALTRQLFGSILEKRRVLELNASDERGIDIIRKKIKSFACLVMNKNITDDKVIPSYKILILDEVDNMTLDAQNALRRIVEIYSEITRFILICNYISSVIEPLISRCAVFRFRSLTVDKIIRTLIPIIKHEKIQITIDTMKELGGISNGDLRKAITLLQSTVRIYGHVVTTQSILEAAGSIQKGLIRELWNVCLKGRIETLYVVVDNIFAEGFPANQILKHLVDHSLSETSINEEQRAKILIHLGSVEKALIDGANERFQIMNVVAAIQRIINKQELDDD